MRTTIRSTQLSTFLLAALLASTWPAVAAQDSPPATGVLWEITSQITMKGMPFVPPPQTLKRCMPAQWEQPPAPEDDARGCVNSQFEHFEKTVTWTSTCAGPPEMAGLGEIVFEDEAAQAYSGKIEEAGIWAEHAETMKLNFEMTGIAADQYRSTDDLKGPVDYLRRATEVFFQRRWGPASEEPGSCEVGHG